MNYYVSIGGKTYGPALLEDLKSWHKSGAFGPQDFVWNESENTWKIAGECSEIALIFSETFSSENNTAGIDEPDEMIQLQTSQIKSETNAEDEQIIFCENHNMNPSTFICSVCKKSFCDSDREEGQIVCIDCVTIEKTKSLSSVKRNIIIASAVIIIIAATLLSYVFFGPQTVSQPAVPQKIELKLSAPPVLTSDTGIAADTTVLTSDTSVIRDTESVKDTSSANLNK